MLAGVFWSIPNDYRAFADASCERPVTDKAAVALDEVSCSSPPNSAHRDRAIRPYPSDHASRLSHLLGEGK